MIEFLSEFSITADRIAFMNSNGLSPNNLATVKNNIDENEELSSAQKEAILKLL